MRSGWLRDDPLRVSDCEQWLLSPMLSATTLLKPVGVLK
jgi:hypothetical protein